MEITVQYGDTLADIAQATLGDERRWRDIASLNGIPAVGGELFVGQRLRLPLGARTARSTPPKRHHGDANGSSSAFRPATRTAGSLHLFVFADEINPFARKLVRKVIIPPPDIVDPLEVLRLSNPERFGFQPRAAGSPVSAGRHVLGRTDSKFVSASELPHGSPRFEGEPFWIDVARLQARGGRIVDGEALAADLARIAAKTKKPEYLAYIEHIRQKALGIDHEVLIEGGVPAAAVKGATSMRVLRGVQFVQGVGLVLTMYDLGKATHQSIEQHSVAPIAAESARQGSGLGGALLGRAAVPIVTRAVAAGVTRWAGAEAGAELFGAGGVAVGVETGPGAVVTGAIGAAIGGIVGFVASDWAVQKLSEFRH